METLTHYKAAIAERGRKIKDLAEGLPMEYGRLSRILNGFSSEPPDFGQQFRDVLKQWDAKVNEGRLERSYSRCGSATAKSGGMSAKNGRIINLNT